MKKKKTKLLNFFIKSFIKLMINIYIYILRTLINIIIIIIMKYYQYHKSLYFKRHSFTQRAREGEIHIYKKQSQIRQ